MLRTLTRMAGLRLVALAYLVATIMPSAAMALGDGAASAICIEELTEQVQQATAVHVHVHVHADGTVHQHVDADTAKPAHDGAPAHPATHTHDDASCCGLFGFSAVLPGLSVPVLAQPAQSIRPTIVAQDLVGRGPARIDRPPILLSAM
jgi:hypothetical protein